MDWADELAAQVRDQRPAGRQRLQDAVGDGPRRQPARPGHPRRHHPRAARQRHRDDAPLRRRRPRPDGRPGAPDARRHRARDGPAAGPRPRPGRRLPRVATRATSRGIFIDVFAGPRHPPRPLLLDERHLPDRGDGPVHPDRRSTGPPLVREIYRRVANVQHPDTWHPLGVICPTCGKVGTTIVTEWDGERVFFECRPDLVDLGARLRRRRAGSRRSAAPPSCRGTSSGRPSGRCSA